jgi:hypothetical protein
MRNKYRECKDFPVLDKNGRSGNFQDKFQAREE